MNELIDIIRFGALGGAGAIVYQLISHGNVLVFPRWWRGDDGKKRGLDLGIFGAVFIGVAIGIAIDHSGITSFTGGLGSTTAAEGLIKRYMATRGSA